MIGQNEALKLKVKIIFKIIVTGD